MKICTPLSPSATRAMLLGSSEFGKEVSMSTSYENQHPFWRKAPHVLGFFKKNL